MHFSSLADLIRHHKDHIIQELNRRLSQVPWTPYQEFILSTKEGQRRLKTWVGLLVRSLEGESETYFKDQERTGYSRARKGFQLDFNFKMFQCFLRIMGEILLESAHKKKIRLVDLWGEIQELNEILLKGHSVTATSFLKTREEIITEKITYLQEIYDFTRKTISIFDLAELINLILSEMTAFFKVEESLILLYRNNRIQGIYTDPPGQETPEISEIMERVLKEGTPLFMDEAKDIFQEIDRAKLKRVVSVPIRAHNRCYGVLALYNKRRGFKFTEKELGLLDQLLYIMAVALENAFMLEEIEQGHQELRLLTGKMITIQEEERKRLAADIHDTLAQALTGISYKIQFCRELVKKNPQVLIDQLDGLIKTVHQAVDQSKELISSLRPDLIDTMGLVPALKRHIENFVKETGIRVRTQLPKRVQTPSEVNICLFRVAQEALTNIYKHAEAKTAEFQLQKKDDDLILVVTDAGKGFDGARGIPWMKDTSRLGLLSMKERLEALGGTLKIHAGMNRGCRVEAKIPLRPGKAHGEN